MTPDQYRRAPIPADGRTIEAMRLALLDTPAGRAMTDAGDTRLYWMNESDAYMLMSPFGIESPFINGGHSVVKVCPICDIAGCRHIREAEKAPDTVARLVEAARALGTMPEGYCFCSADRVGDDSKTHEPECVDLRAALAAMENEQCQVSIEPATGVTTNGLHGSGADAPVAGGNSHPDAVAGRPCTDCGQTHDTDGDICPTCVCVRAEIAAMETDHD